jgi:hypothetical protein
MQLSRYGRNLIGASSQSGTWTPRLPTMKIRPKVHGEMQRDIRGRAPRDVNSFYGVAELVSSPGASQRCRQGRKV